MEPIHIFCKELPTDENNIFVVNLAEKNEVESVKFKKSREYAITGLSIHQDTGSTEVAITDTDRLETLSNLIQKLVKEKKRTKPWPCNKQWRNIRNSNFVPKKTESEVPKVKLTTTQQLKKRNNWIL